MATRDDITPTHTLRTMSDAAIRHLRAHLLRRAAKQAHDDDMIRDCDDELRARLARAFRAPNPFEGLAWDDAVEGQQSLFDYAATLSRTQGR